MDQENHGHKEQHLQPENWILGDVLSAIVIGAGIATMVVKAFFSS